MNLSRKIAALTCCVALSFTACQKDEAAPSTSTGGETSNSSSVSGVAQKGPFKAGSKIKFRIYNNSLSEIIDSIETTIKDEAGSYDLNIDRGDYKYAEVIVDGKFYHEYKDADTEEKSKLRALIDLENTTKLNVNIITELTHKRIMYLVRNGSTLAEAKTQALAELSTIFKLESNVSTYNDLNIAEAGTNNNALLAITLATMGDTSQAALNAFIERFKTDLAEDGTIEDSIKEVLEDNSIKINTEKAKINIAKKMRALGKEFKNENFDKILEKYSSKHGDSTMMDTTILDRLFLTDTLYGSNLIVLNKDSLTIEANKEYNISAIIPSVVGTKGFVNVSLFNFENDGAVVINEDRSLNWKIESNASENAYFFGTSAKNKLAKVPVKFTGAGSCHVKVKVFLDGYVKVNRYKLIWE